MVTVSASCSVLHTYILGESPLTLFRRLSLWVPHVTLEVMRAKIVMNFWLYRIQVLVLGAVHQWDGFRRVGKQDAEETILTCLVAGEKKKPLALRLAVCLKWVHFVFIEFKTNEWVASNRILLRMPEGVHCVHYATWKCMAETYLDVQRTILGRGQRFFGHSFMINRFG